jgi:hypothetical protein
MKKNTATLLATNCILAQTSVVIWFLNHGALTLLGFLQVSEGSLIPNQGVVVGCDEQFEFLNI